MKIERQAIADVHAGRRHAHQLAAEFQPGTITRLFRHPPSGPET